MNELSEYPFLRIFGNFPKFDFFTNFPPYTQVSTILFYLLTPGKAGIEILTTRKMTPRRKTSGGRPGPKKKKLGHFARQAGALRAWHSNKSHVAKNVTKSILSYDDCRVTGSEMKGIDVAKKNVMGIAVWPGREWNGSMSQKNATKSFFFSL